MYTFKLCKSFLLKEETEVFKAFLNHYHVDESIWDVYACLFKSAVKGTVPLVLKVYKESELCGSAIIIKCSRYGKSLFDNKLIAGMIDMLGVPVYLWIRFGCCMDMASNPGFVKNPEKADEIQAAMAQFLRRRNLFTIIYDYTDKCYLFPGSIALPALPHALIDTGNMRNIQDYISGHKNIKRKMNIFRNNGGTFEIISNVLQNEDIPLVRKCFISTAENSVSYLPYQDIYLNSALKTCSSYLNNVFYFVARLNGQFLGYQAALKTGTCLNALHGAFDRERDTTYHSYDILFVKMTEFAIENGLSSIDFGAVLNITKARMVNKTVDMSYFLYTRYSPIKSFFTSLLRLSKFQGEKQLKFRDYKMVP